ARREGIGNVRLETLTLAANFRSHAGLVGWVNETFARIMPAIEDIATGAVKYSPSEAVHASEREAVAVHAFHGGDGAGEADEVVRIAEVALAQPSSGAAGPASVAILVRNRSHLLDIMPRLREAKLAFRAIEIQPLDSSRRRGSRVARVGRPGMRGERHRPRGRRDLPRSPRIERGGRLHCRSRRVRAIACAAFRASRPSRARVPAGDDDPQGEGA